jgi:2-keto-4-pentenoate hydratase/2-oxohepta-3-ene-1,7-dioic acid hydratase in catechol pathway
MKLARYRRGSAAASFGTVINIEGGSCLLDLGAAFAASRFSDGAPSSMIELARRGAGGLDQAREVQAWALRQGEGGWLADSEEVEWLVPIEVRNAFCAGRNFGRHLGESQGAAAPGKTYHNEFPTGFLKLPDVLVGHKARVKRPPDVTEFDYEVEVAAIIGAPAYRVGKERALEAVFGYTVFNDLGAREWQRKEMSNGLLLMGKNFPGFGPIGPWIVTADEITDPSLLTVELRVNGDVRQHSGCDDMIFSFADLIAFWSRAGLEPGDLIASGTPSGVALHRKPDPFAFYLKPGDVVEAIVDGIGVLETVITE